MGTCSDLAGNDRKSTFFDKNFNRELQADIFLNSGSRRGAFKRKAMYKSAFKQKGPVKLDYNNLFESSCPVPFGLSELPVLPMPKVLYPLA